MAWLIETCFVADGLVEHARVLVVAGRQAEHGRLDRLHQQEHAIVIIVHLDLDEAAGGGEARRAGVAHRPEQVVGQFVPHQREVDEGGVQDPFLFLRKTEPGGVLLQFEGHGFLRVIPRGGAPEFDGPGPRGGVARPGARRKDQLRRAFVGVVAEGVGLDLEQGEVLDFIAQTRDAQ